MSELYDFTKFSEEQKEDYSYYGIIPGPVHNNFNVTTIDNYICSFECIISSNLRIIYDMYIIPGKYDTILLRESSEWEGSYSSMHIEIAMYSLNHMPWKQAFHILCSKGSFKWSSNYVSKSC